MDGLSNFRRITNVYEYKQEEYHKNVSMIAANKNSSDGWELVCVFPSSESMVNIVFKREKETQGAGK